MNNVAGTGVVSKTEDALLQSYGFWSRDPEMLNSFSPVTPLPSDILSLPQYAILQTEGEKQEDENSLLPRLEYISCVIHFAFFGILGFLFHGFWGKGQGKILLNFSLLSRGLNPHKARLISRTIRSFLRFPSIYRCFGHNSQHYRCDAQLP
ncbi:hypothetical protein Ancab_033144 [Ancistrocladus abbreviatus]